MQTILEHGIAISFTDEEKYNKVKEILDELNKHVLELFPSPKKKGLHGVTLRDKNLLLTCYLFDGVLRFGIYHVKERELHRWCDVDVLYNLSEGTFLDLIKRLEHSINKNLELPPLNELWEASVRKELSFTDKNGLVEINNPEIMTVKYESSQEKIRLNEEELQRYPQLTI